MPGSDTETKMTPEEKEAAENKLKKKRKTQVTLADSLKSLGGAVRILTRRYGFEEVMYSVLWTNPDLHQVALKTMKDQDRDDYVIPESHDDEEYSPTKYLMTNHFPGMRTMCTKIHLTRNINYLKNLYPEEFKFYPNSWDLSDPENFAEFETYFQSHLEEGKTYILKPSSGLKGNGIVLAQTWADVTTCLQARKDLNLIAQEYMDEPLLLDGLKMDFRIYVCISNLNPYTAYVFHDGLARFATKPYQPPAPTNIAEVYMHLTNYSLNKDSTEFKSAPKPQMFRKPTTATTAATPTATATPQPVTYCDEESASKRSIKTTLRQLEKLNVDPAEFWKEVDDIADKTLVAILVPLWRKYNAMFGATKTKKRVPNAKASNPSKCFQIIGFDLLPIVSRNKVTGKTETRLILLELNQNPCFRCSQSEVDFSIKQGVLGQALELMDILHAPVSETQGQRPFAYTKLRPYSKYGYMIEAAQKTAPPPL